MNLNRAVAVRRSNEVGIGRDGELAGGVVFLLECELELESLCPRSYKQNYRVLREIAKTSHRQTTPAKTNSARCTSSLVLVEWMTILVDNMTK